MPSRNRVEVVITGTNQATPALQGVSRELGNLGGQAERTSGLLGGLGRGFGGLVSGLGQLGLAAMGATAAFDGLQGIGKMLGVGLASDLNESMNKVDVVFGSAAASIKAFGDTAAESLGLSKGEAMEAAGTFGNLFVSMGLGKGKAADLSKEVLTLGADLASFNNIGVDDALEKLRSGLVGESEPLRALGVNLNEDMVKAKALAMGLTDLSGNVTEAGKVQARYALIMEQTATAHGDFKNTASGMANATRIINASLKNLRTEIGQELLPAIAPLVADFSKALPSAMKALRPLIEGFGQAARDAIGSIIALGKGVRDLVGYLDPGNKRDVMREWFGGDVGPKIDQFVRALKRIPETLRNAVSDVEDFWSHLTLMFEEGGIGGVLGYLGRLGSDLAQGVEEMLGRAWASVDWAAIWAKAQGIGQGLITSALTIATNVKDWLAAQWAAIPWGEVWTKAVGIGSGLVSSALAIAGDVTTWLGQQWAGIKWGEVWAKVVGVATGIGGEAWNIVTQVTGWLGAQFNSIKWDQVWGAVTGIASGIGGKAWDIVTALADWLGAQWNAIDWAAVWQAAERLGTALAENGPKIAGDVQIWAAREWARVDWGKVWGDAVAGAKDLDEKTAAALEKQSWVGVGQTVGGAFVDAVLGVWQAEWALIAGGGASKGGTVFLPVKTVQQLSQRFYEFGVGLGLALIEGVTVKLPDLGVKLYNGLLDILKNLKVTFGVFTIDSSGFHIDWGAMPPPPASYPGWQGAPAPPSPTSMPDRQPARSFNPTLNFYGNADAATVQRGVLAAARSLGYA